MNHTSLEIFCVVAGELSITRAARLLGRVQSNITTRIQQLEEELGVALFVRESKQLRLSAEGKQFLQYAKKLLALAEEARQSLHPQHPAGTLRLGSMECTAASRLAGPLVAFSKAFPDVQLTLTTQPTQQSLAAVVNAELDCALVALPRAADGTPVCPPELSALPLFDEALLLLLPVSLQGIGDYSEVQGVTLATFRAGCSYRALAEQYLPAPLSMQEVSSYHTMLACVAGGNAVCLLPASVLALMQHPQSLHSLPVCNAMTWLVWRNGYSSPAFNQLRHLLSEAAKSAARQ
ncbi:LysR family transcriptional regulator [Pantoea sp. A4]|uniref:LysR family transcriptional regulator n=1 Tax=Pantoea sp. A4 TaxID=1225184 RepID=UPI00035CFD2B|nr:LysR family transcriptional regulator [Pantoea sp. A4]